MGATMGARWQRTRSRATQRPWSEWRPPLTRRQVSDATSWAQRLSNVQALTEVPVHTCKAPACQAQPSDHEKGVVLWGADSSPGIDARNPVRLSPPRSRTITWGCRFPTRSGVFAHRCARSHSCLIRACFDRLQDGGGSPSQPPLISLARESSVGESPSAITALWRTFDAQYMQVCLVWPSPALRRTSITCETARFAVRRWSIVWLMVDATLRRGRRGGPRRG